MLCCGRVVSYERSTCAKLTCNAMTRFNPHEHISEWSTQLAAAENCTQQFGPCLGRRSGRALGAINDIMQHRDIAVGVGPRRPWQRLVGQISACKRLCSSHHYRHSTTDLRGQPGAVRTGRVSAMVHTSTLRHAQLRAAEPWAMISMDLAHAEQIRAGQRCSLRRGIDARPSSAAIR